MPSHKYFVVKVFALFLFLSSFFAYTMSHLNDVEPTNFHLTQR